jgi:hypothetical protein
MLKHIQAPHTEFGAKLKLTQEQEDICKVLYYPNDDGILTFAGLYDDAIADSDYPKEMVAVPLKSSFGGTHNFLAGAAVWNAIGSNGDVWHGNIAPATNSPVWISIWQQETNGNPNICYVAGSRWAVDGRTNCNGPFMGGHMIITANTPNPGTNGSVYIIPICRDAHNHGHFQMAVSQNVTGLVLNNYHR